MEGIVLLRRCSPVASDCTSLPSWKKAISDAIRQGQLKVLEVVQAAKDREEEYELESKLSKVEDLKTRELRECRVELSVIDHLLPPSELIRHRTFSSKPPETLEEMRRALLKDDVNVKTVFDFNLLLKNILDTRLKSVYKSAMDEAFPWFSQPSDFLDSVQRQIVPPNADHCYIATKEKATERKPITTTTNESLTKSIASDNNPQLKLYNGALCILRLGRRIRGVSDTAVLRQSKEKSRFDVPVDFESSRLFWSCTQPRTRVRYFCRTRLIERPQELEEMNVAIEAGHLEEEKLLREARRALRSRTINEMIEKQDKLLPPDAFKFIWPSLEMHEEKVEPPNDTSKTVIDLDEYLQSAVINSDSPSKAATTSSSPSRSLMASPERRLNKAVGNVLNLRHSPLKQKLIFDTNECEKSDSELSPSTVDDVEVVRAWFNVHKGKCVRALRTQCSLPFVYTNREMDSWLSLNEDEKHNKKEEDEDSRSSETPVSLSELFFESKNDDASALSETSVMALLNLPQEKLLEETHSLLALDDFEDEDDFNAGGDNFTLALSPETCIMQLDGQDDSEVTKSFSINHLLSPVPQRDEDDDVVVLSSTLSSRRPLLPKPAVSNANVLSRGQPPRLQYLTSISGVTSSTLNSIAAAIPTFQVMPSSTLALSMNSSRAVWGSPMALQTYPTNAVMQQAANTFGRSVQPFHPMSSMQQMNSLQSTQQLQLLQSMPPLSHQVPQHFMPRPMQQMPPLIPHQSMMQFGVPSMGQPLVFSAAMPHPSVTQDHLGHRKVARVQPLLSSKAEVRSEMEPLRNRDKLNVEKNDADRNSVQSSKVLRRSIGTQALATSVTTTISPMITVATTASFVLTTATTPTKTSSRVRPVVTTAPLTPSTTAQTTVITTTTTSTTSTKSKFTMKALSEIEIEMKRSSSNDLKVSEIRKTGNLSSKSVQSAVSRLKRKGTKKPLAFIAFPDEESLLNEFTIDCTKNENEVWQPTKLASNRQRVSPDSRIVYEVKAEDGSFHSEASDPSVLWQQVFKAVHEARNESESSLMVDGFEMMGLAEAAVALLVQQLPFEDEDGFIETADTIDDDEEWTGSTSGSARCEGFRERRVFDMFGWLASKYRRRPHPNVGLDLSDILDQNEPSGPSIRRTLSLPISTRFRQLPKRAKTHVGVFRSGIHGRGIFCRRPIMAGEMVIEYAGERIRAILTDKREKTYQAKGIGCYMFRLDDHTVVDATLKGNAARFINHSCDPNCYSKIVDVLGRKHIVIFALRNIVPGEELTYDYKFPIEDVKIPCTCGAKKCRKYMN